MFCEPVLGVLLFFQALGRPVKVGEFLSVLFKKVSLRCIGQWCNMLKQSDCDVWKVINTVVITANGNYQAVIDEMAPKFKDFTEDELRSMISNITSNMPMFCAECSGVLVRKKHSNESENCYMCTNCKRLTCSCRKARN